MENVLVDVKHIIFSYLLPFRYYVLCRHNNMDPSIKKYFDKSSANNRSILFLCKWKVSPDCEDFILKCIIHLIGIHNPSYSYFNKCIHESTQAGLFKISRYFYQVHKIGYPYDVMYLAISHSNDTFVDELFEQGYKYERNMLSCAIYRKNLYIIKNIIESGISANRYALAACLDGNLEIVQYFDSIGIKFDSECMLFAAEEGKLEIVKYLYAIGTPFTSNALHRAKRDNHIDVVEFLESVTKLKH